MTTKILSKRTSTPATARTAKTKPETVRQWAERYCNERGHDLKFAIANGVTVTTGYDGDYGYKPKQAGIIYSCIHPISKRDLTSGRIRYQFPPQGAKGKEIKFKQRAETSLNPYFASVLDWRKAFKDVKIPLIISEGETRALAGAKHGFHVVGLGGVEGGFEAGTHRGLLTPLLREIEWKGRKVTVIFDADISTNKRVEDAANALTKLLSEQGADVRQGNIAAFMPHAGLDDLLAKYGAPSLQMICDAAEAPRKTQLVGEVISRSLDEVEDQDVDYIWEDRVARGMLNMFSGDPASGKTFVALSLAADLTRGRVPGSKVATKKPMTVVYASNENSSEHVTGPRFRAMRGNTKKLIVIEGAVDARGKATSLSFGNLDPIEREIVRRKAGLLIFDPVQSYFGDDKDSHKATEVRPRMDALISLAKRHNIGVLLIRHLSKSSGGRAIHRGQGSIDFTGAARIELMVGNYRHQPAQRPHP